MRAIRKVSGSIGSLLISKTRGPASKRLTLPPLIHAYLFSVLPLLPPVVIDSSESAFMEVLVEKTNRYKKLRRLLFFAVLPLSLVAKAVYSVVKAMRQREDKLLAAVAPEDAAAVLEAMKAHLLGRNAAVIGAAGAGKPGRVSLTGEMGSSRLLRMPSGEQLPRIC